MSSDKIKIFFLDFIWFHTFGLSQIPLHALDEDAIGRVVLQDELEVLFADLDSSADVVQ